MKQGMVSVIIPVYNGATYLERTLDSALNQTWKNVEVIVVDDGSKDESASILTSYGSRIAYIQQDNAGPAAARHSGVAASHGEYLAFLDQDDVWDKDKLERQLTLLEAHAQAVGAYCDHRSIDNNDQVIGATGAEGHMRGSGQILDALIDGNFILTASVVILRRTAYDRAGGFDLSNPYWGDDYDLWMRTAALGPFIYQVDTLVSYRRHDNNTSGSDYQMLAGNAHALKNVERFLLNSVNHRTRERLRDSIYSALLGKAWHLEHSCSPSSACKIYVECLILKPLNLIIWRGLLYSLVMTFLSYFSMNYTDKDKS